MSTPEEKTKVSCSVDLLGRGKQLGNMIVPHSTDTSAWGSIEIPIAVISGGDGPVVLFTAASHGDEYEGPIALSKLIHDLEPSQILGTVIIIPALNLPAFRATTRLSPIDGRNMNRAFPGAYDGTITPMIAHFLSTQIIPLCDVVVDIHSGGKTLKFLPCSVMHELINVTQMTQTLAALEAFGAPVGLVLTELDAAGMMDTTVEEMGKIFLSTEMGGGGSTTPETVRLTDRGVRNILAHFGLLEEAPVRREDVGETPTRLMHTPNGSCFTSALDNGLFEPFKALGDKVKKGEALGQIHYVEYPDRVPLVHYADHTGTVLCKGVPGLVAKGDCLVVIAEDYRVA